MGTTLRAFLMCELADGEWDISVHHGLEELVRAWNMRPNQDGAGVLHVGFDRRPAREFNEIAREFGSKLILTGAAKGALPRTFRTSTHPIGTVANEQLFLALEGWGYTAEEPEQTHEPPTTTAFLGWVGSYVEAHPDQITLLQPAGIHDEASYLAHEEELSLDLRHQLGLFRFRARLEGDPEDPCAIARAAPPWLALQDVESLDLTVRLGNVFKNQGMRRVEDIGSYSLADLMRLPNFGRTSAFHLTEILKRALDEGPKLIEQEVMAIVATTLLESVRRSLEGCSEREADILRRRMGLDCRAETLAEIGECYGVTRERIRQIEEKVVGRLIRQELWDDVLAEKLHQLLTDREFPLPLMGVEALDPWFEGAAQHRDAVRYLLHNMCTAGGSLVEIDEIEYLSFLKQEEWTAALQSARNLLSSGNERGWLRADCRRYVEAILPVHGQEFRGILWETASRWCHFTDDTDEALLTAYGRGVEQVVETVLYEAEEPLHYSQIADLASKRSGREIDARRAHNAAAEVGYLFGPGTYGLLKHVPIPRETLDAIADEAAEIVAEGPSGRQWHTSELIDTLLERGVTMDGTITKHVLDIALKQQRQLRSLGRMVWTSEEHSESARLDIRQCVIAILQQAGRPLSSAELHQRFVAVRGINQGMQFSAVDPIIKLDSQLWGLNDRDIAVKRPDQPAFLDGVVSTLRARGSPVHISECSTAVGGLVPPRAVFSLAALDPRLQVTPGRFLALR